VTRVQDLLRTIDGSEPGRLLSFKIYRQGQTQNYLVPVGRETYRRQGTVVIGFPPFLEAPDLIPNPNFSLIAAGYRQETRRTELSSVDATYRRNCNPKGYQAVDGEWRFWLVFMSLSKEKIILTQESVPPTVAAPVIASK